MEGSWEERRQFPRWWQDAGWGESVISVKLSSVSRALENGQFHLYILLSRRILPGCVCVTLFTTVCSAFHTHRAYVHVHKLLATRVNFSCPLSYSLNVSFL